MYAAFADKRTTLGSVAEAVSDDAVPAPYLYARMVRTLPQTLFSLWFGRIVLLL